MKPTALKQGSKKQIEPQLLLADAATVAQMLSISPRYFITLCDTGRMGPESVPLGKRRLWRVREVERWVEAGLPCRADWSKEGVNAE